ncbi:magnesium chelatase subunit D [Oceaniglobus roseus]|uniref:magnesium chelatase subunit D n=1 Tax=Oceaniglobus roseus TaxID=1737570 RepID=UPI000C7EB6D3|nr:magnesium chelatase subunit D [Kandeliimicrobium roseum]
MTGPLAPWPRALLALRLLAVDPVGLGGLWLRARPSPARDALLAGLGALHLPVRRIHPGIGAGELHGGLDLTAALAEGRMVRREGLLYRPAALLLAMAERCPPSLAVQLGQALDARSAALVALEGGGGEDEALPPALADRLALFLDLSEVPLSAVTEPVAEDFTAARARLPKVRVPAPAIADLAHTAAALGIASLRAPLHALAAARALAALGGHDEVTQDDLQRAVELVYPHRATVLPAPEEPDQAETEPESQQDPAPQGQTEQAEIPQDVLLEAALTALPRDLLARLAAGHAARSASGAPGSGAGRRGNRRGRPLPSRPGRLDGRSRIDLVATLTSAAPWQAMRRAQVPGKPGLHIRPGDIRVKRYQETSDRLLIFAVDASGSAAMARLAEAKGAVEILLGEAYARRDHVALIAFRGETAELLLPPTRSLVQTKRRLAALPGGGGTPLAAALKAALDVAQQARGKGMTPSIALLTDGRANIALDGTANRAQAAEDATRMARALRRLGTPSLVIDTARRPQDSLKDLARILDAPCIALPRADARALSATLGAALDG